MIGMGGYFAELKLLTDQSSFSSGVKLLGQVDDASRKMGKSFEQAQNQMSSTMRRFSRGASDGSNWKYAENLGHRTLGRDMIKYGGGSGGEPPIPGSGRDTEMDPEKKTEAKKNTLARIGTLYALWKVTKFMYNLTEAIVKSTVVQTEAMSKSYVTAARVGMSQADAKKWESAFKIANLDMGDFMGKVGDMNSVFENLKQGMDTGVEPLAKQLGFLHLDFGKLREMNSGQRVDAIFEALYKMSTTGFKNERPDPGKANQLAAMLLGNAGAEALVKMLTLGKSPSDFKGMGLTNVTPNAETVKSAVEVGKLGQEIDEYKKVFANRFMGDMLPALTELNDWIRAHNPQIQSSIQGLADAFARAAKEIIGAVPSMIEFAIDPAGKSKSNMKYFWERFKNSKSAGDLLGAGAAAFNFGLYSVPSFLGNLGAGSPSEKSLKDKFIPSAGSYTRDAFPPINMELTIHDERSGQILTGKYTTAGKSR